MSHTRRGAMLAGASLCLTGCFGPSQTRMRLTIKADAQLNPNPSNVPTPLALKFYELASADAFGTASFSDLFYNPADALRSDLLNTFAMEITPSSITDVQRTLNSQAQFLGVVAGYRNIANATWRLTAPLNIRGSNRIRLAAGRLALAFVQDGGW